MELVIHTECHLFDFPATKSMWHYYCCLNLVRYRFAVLLSLGAVDGSTAYSTDCVRCCPMPSMQYPAPGVTTVRNAAVSGHGVSLLFDIAVHHRPGSYYYVHHRSLEARVSVL